MFPVRRKPSSMSTAQHAALKFACPSENMASSFNRTSSFTCIQSFWTRQLEIYDQLLLAHATQRRCTKMDYMTTAEPCEGAPNLLLSFLLSAHELPTYAPPKQATKRTWQEKTTYHGTTSVRSILIAQITHSRSILECLWNVWSTHKSNMQEQLLWVVVFKPPSACR